MPAARRAPQPAVPLDDVRRGQLVVTEGGPLGSAAFWAGDLADRQRSTARTSNPHTPVHVLRILGYRATDRTRRIRFRKDWHDAIVVAWRALQQVPS